MYSILPVIVLYYDTINRDATRIEVHQAKGKHESGQNYRAIYEMADTACKNFIMEVVDETWYKDLKDTDVLYTNVTALKLLDHLTEFCLVLHTIGAVNFPQYMKTLFSDVNGIPQFINAMEAAQQKSKRAKLVIQDKYMQDVVLKLLPQSGDYETETREWSNSLTINKPRYCGRQPSWRHMWQSDGPKQPEKERENPSVDPW